MPFPDNNESARQREQRKLRESRFFDARNRGTDISAPPQQNAAGGLGGGGMFSRPQPQMQVQQPFLPAPVFTQFEQGPDFRLNATQDTRNNRLQQTFQRPFGIGGFGGGFSSGGGGFAGGGRGGSGGGGFGMGGMGPNRRRSLYR